MQTTYKKYKFVKVSKGQKSMPQRSEEGFFHHIIFTLI